MLPLEERAAGDRTYFADGLTEDLITRLGQVQGLAVLGRSATRELRGVSPAEAAKRLNVEAVLTGSVQREAGELKVSLELVDPDDGVVVWSQRYTKAIDSVFAVQAAIADDVAQALRLKLAGDLRQRTAHARSMCAHTISISRRGMRSPGATFDKAIGSVPIRLCRWTVGLRKRTPGWPKRSTCTRLQAAGSTQIALAKLPPPPSARSPSIRILRRRSSRPGSPSPGFARACGT